MGGLQIVVFGLNGLVFGAETSQVFQIIRYQEVTKIPEAPGFVEGMIEYRGAVLPVVSLNKRFNLGENEIGNKTKIIITKIDDRLAGFIVNDVLEILKLSEEDVEPAPLIANTESATYLKKVGKKDGRLISIIDLAKILDISEIRRLSAEMKDQRYL